MLGVALMLLDVTLQACTWLTAGSFKLTAGYNECNLCADTEAEDKLARRHLHGGILQRMGKIMLDTASVSLLQFTLGWMPASYGRRMEQTRTKSSRSRRNGG